MSGREHRKRQGARPAMDDGAEFTWMNQVVARSGGQMGGFSVHFEDKADIICHQVRRGRGQGSEGNTADYSETSRKQEGQEGNCSETPGHSSGQSPQAARGHPQGPRECAQEPSFPEILHRTRHSTESPKASREHRAFPGPGLGSPGV